MVSSVGVQIKWSGFELRGALCVVLLGMTLLQCLSTPGQEKEWATVLFHFGGWGRGVVGGGSIFSLFQGYLRGERRLSHECKEQNAPYW